MRRSNATAPALPASLLLATLALAAGCSRCGAPAASPPAERLVPASARGVVLVPRLAEAARQAAALHATLAALPGQEELLQLRTVLGAQLSFDPFDPASLAGAGLDVERGLAVAELAGVDQQPGWPLLVLPVGDPGKFEGLVTRLAKERLGAAEQGLENANGKSIQVWRRAAGEPALLAVAMVERTALVSAGPGGPDALRAALALDPALSLEKSPTWQRARAALGEAGSVLVFAPPGVAELAGSPAAHGLAAGLSATAQSARLVAVGLLGADETRVRPLAAPGQGRTGPFSLDPSSVAAARVSADLPTTLKLGLAALGLVDTPPEGDRLFTAVARVLAALEPPIDLGLALSPRAEVGAALATRGQLEPLRVLRAEAVAPVKAGARLGPLLDELAAAAHGRGKDGRWHIPAGRAEVAWTVAGGRLLAAAGEPGALDALVARAAGQGWKPPSPAASAALAGGLGGLVVDGANLAKAVQDLPPESFGSGPDAVVARSLAERLTGPGAAGTVSLRADLPEGALRLSLEIELPPPPKAP